MAKVNLDLIIPRFLEVKTITSAQILAAFTTPITFVDAAPGFWLAPLWAWFEKPAGTAYTIGGATKFGVWNEAQEMIDVPMAGFLDQAIAITAVSRGPGTNATSMVGGGLFNSNVVPLPNKPLVITNAVANVTVGTANVRISVLYQKVPTSIPWF